MTVTVLAGDHIVSNETIRDLKRSLRPLGSGVSRTAYDLGNGYVLKVGKANSFAGGNQTEVACWEHLKDVPEVAGFLAEITAYDSESFSWLIMRKVDGMVGDDYEILQKWYASDVKHILRGYGISDLHDQNVGYMIDPVTDEVSFLAVDYAMSGYCDEAFTPEESYPSHCATCCHGCSDHSERGRSDACCEVAAFNVDDCGTLQGCDEEWCDVPNCGNRAMHVLCTLHNLRHGMFHAFGADNVWTQDRAVVCGQHLPIDPHNADMIREFNGQIPMFGAYAWRIV